MAETIVVETDIAVIGGGAAGCLKEGKKKAR